MMAAFRSLSGSTATSTGSNLGDNDIVINEHEWKAKEEAVPAPVSVSRRVGEDQYNRLIEPDGTSVSLQQNKENPRMLLFRALRELPDNSEAASEEVCILADSSRTIFVIESNRMASWIDFFGTVNKSRGREVYQIKAKHDDILHLCDLLKRLGCGVSDRRENKEIPLIHARVVPQEELGQLGQHQPPTTRNQSSEGLQAGSVASPTQATSTNSAEPMQQTTSSNSASVASSSNPSSGMAEDFVASPYAHAPKHQVQSREFLSKKRPRKLDYQPEAPHSPSSDRKQQPTSPFHTPPRKAPTLTEVLSTVTKNDSRRIEVEREERKADREDKRALIVLLEKQSARESKLAEGQNKLVEGQNKLVEGQNKLVEALLSAQKTNSSSRPDPSTAHMPQGSQPPTLPMTTGSFHSTPSGQKETQPFLHYQPWPGMTLNQQNQMMYCPSPIPSFASQQPTRQHSALYPPSAGRTERAPSDHNTSSQAIPSQAKVSTDQDEEESDDSLAVSSNAGQDVADLSPNADDGHVPTEEQHPAPDSLRHPSLNSRPDATNGAPYHGGHWVAPPYSGHQYQHGPMFYPPPASPTCGPPSDQQTSGQPIPSRRVMAGHRAEPASSSSNEHQVQELNGGSSAASNVQGVAGPSANRNADAGRIPTDRRQPRLYSELHPAENQQGPTLQTRRDEKAIWRVAKNGKEYDASRKRPNSAYHTAHGTLCRECEKYRDERYFESVTAKQMGRKVKSKKDRKMWCTKHTKANENYGFPWCKNKKDSTGADLLKTERDERAKQFRKARRNRGELDYDTDKGE